jgi:hypothetical protein
MPGRPWGGFGAAQGEISLERRRIAERIALNRRGNCTFLRGQGMRFQQPPDGDTQPGLSHLSVPVECPL